ncbi:MAG: hypothetical protein JW829_06475 [Pirellulales bacterium]|nr:hypothetical protein [Pirellulales bacterium]
MSSLLLLALFFKFNRVWSVRNLDLLGMILLVPGLLLVQHSLDHAGVPNAATIEYIGYIWLFIVDAFLMLRLLIDSTMVRRPLLDPNMTVGGLAFLAVSLFCFLMANVVNGTPGEGGLEGAQAAEDLSRGQQETSAEETFNRFGPGLQSLFLLPQISTRVAVEVILGDDGESRQTTPTSGSRQQFILELTAKVMAILSHLAIVLGMILIGTWHFDNTKAGIAAATLYLMLPYMALWTGYVSHALPAALLVWAVVMYRQPLLAGVFFGLAFSVVYYPAYLTPLWLSFYWRRGSARFVVGVLISILLVLFSFVFTSIDFGEFWMQVRAMFGFRLPTLDDRNLGGIWEYWNQVYRLPLLAIFLCIAFGMAIWPSQKNLGTLISCSAAIMLGTQFWHPTTSGLAMAWYLPLTLLTVFRPNLEDRVAETVLARAQWVIPWRRDSG